ncbi:unnamed protein product [Moneuplotes crassus]|uniref:Uncharacterized protein n=1 Tax=Euplotes crassus TaxID=5936 RepID=A0AAD1X5X9_EUPCR|nr:unnamed protein product [Moneuplotes crassus]
MFLSNQLNEKPWENNIDKTVAQTYEFYKTAHGFNIGGGVKPDRKKTRYEALSEQRFNVKRYNSVVRNNQKKRERTYKNIVLDKKLESLERIENRKLERKILQYKCNQSLGRQTDLKDIRDIKDNDKELFDLLSTKRSTTFRDPTKPFVSNKNAWEAFNALPAPEVKKLIRPNIVKMDQKAVSRIMERIKNEEMLDTMHQMWIQEQRQHLRNSLKKRHDDQIDLLKRSGLRKNFRSLRQAANDSRLRGTMTQSVKVKDDISEIDHIITNESLNLPNDNDASIITKREDFLERVNIEDPNIRYSNVSREDDQMIMNRNRSTDLTMTKFAHSLKNMKNTQVEPILEPLPEPTNRMTHILKPLSFADTKKFDRLHNQPKYTGISSPFLAADFRGLLIADYNEALNNCNKNYQTLTKFDKNSLGSNRIRVGKYKSNATSEVFPSPYDMTKFNMNSTKNLKKNLKITHKTAEGFFSSTKDQNTPKD